MKTSSYPEIEYWSRLIRESDGIVNEKTNPNGTIDDRSKQQEYSIEVSKRLLLDILDCLNERTTEKVYHDYLILDAKTGSYCL